MVKIRLARYGKKHAPVYRLVAIDSRSKRDGKAIEFLGSYDPAQPKESKFKFNEERVKYWLSVGAQPTETVRDYLAKADLVEANAKNYTKKAGQKTIDRREKAAGESKNSDTPEANNDSDSDKAEVSAENSKTEAEEDTKNS